MHTMKRIPELKLLDAVTSCKPRNRINRGMHGGRIPRFVYREADVNR